MPEGIGPRTLIARMMGNAGCLPIEPTDKEIERYRLVSSFQEKVQHRAMLRHEYLSPTVQRATYEGGITVTVDLENDTYVIEG